MDPLAILPHSPKIGGQEKGNYFSIRTIFDKENRQILFTRKQNEVK